MCISIPAKILEVNGEKALADFLGERREVDAKYVPVKVGYYVSCFGGYVLEKIEKALAERTLDELKNFD